MNKTRLMILANWLLAGAPHKHITFNMSHVLMPTWIDDTRRDWWHSGEEMHNEDIESVDACIAGCTNMFFESEGMDWIELTSMGRAATLLGLTDSQASQLFYATNNCLQSDVDDPSFDSISPEFAGTVIKNFVETGVIDWHLKQFMNS